MTDKLIEELKELIINVCNLDTVDITAEQISSEAPLVGPQSELGIDSLDAIEIVAAVEKKYGVRINNVNTAQTILKTLDSLAEFIRRENPQLAAV